MSAVVVAAVAVAAWLGPADAQELDLELLQAPDPIVIQHTPAPYRGMGNNSVDWSGLIRAHFPESQLTTALRIIACESGGNPYALNPSGARGLFQIMPFWASAYGVPYDSFDDPSVNAEVARFVWEQQGWGAWSCF